MNKRTTLKTGLVSLIAGTILATTSCGGSSSPTPVTPIITNNPTDINNVNTGIYQNENSIVCYNGDDLVLSASITDEDGIYKVYGKIGSNDWVESIKLGEIYTLNLPKEQYGNTPGNKIVKLLVEDDKDNHFETQIDDVPVYMNDQDMYDIDSSDGIWLENKFNELSDVNTDTVYSQAPEELADIGFFNITDKYYNILIVSSKEDQTYIDAVNSENGAKAITPCVNSSELETKISEMTFPDY